eukprot:Lithocolla_globosa_v1_NODE_3807_length_1574_cov_63.998683.p2 type:complete len:164 gc:universal NODE_3807_length_1574_cov_63.998683:767-276(-)
MATQAAAGEVSRWCVLYPCYIDGSKTIAEGRKVPQEGAPTNPALPDMTNVATGLGFKVQMEVKKRHPKNQEVFGRLRIQLKDAEGKPTTPLENRKEMYQAIAAGVKKLQDAGTAATPRSIYTLAKKPGAPTPQVGSSSTQTPTTSSTAAAGGSKKDKKGKNKK